MLYRENKIIIIDCAKKRLKRVVDSVGTRFYRIKRHQRN